TVNACRDVAQRQLARRHEPLVEDRREALDADPAQRAEQSALRRELGSCLAGLPAAQAKVIVLKDAFELSFEEIADAEGVPVGTAKSHAHRGRARLRGELASRLPA
ncbi:MAG TPA: RNA polymerase sigma factor, partial [Gaiellaceae bacterium]|nr:RNA polymerase sigma factor [Gaiellaceae bacterium]